LPENSEGDQKLKELLAALVAHPGKRN